MPTRRRFLAAIASLAAAAGLSRLAGGAGVTAHVKPAAPPTAGEGVTYTRVAWVRGLDGPVDPRAGLYVLVAYADPLAGGKSRFGIMRFDERGRLVDVSSELPEAPL